MFSGLGLLLPATIITFFICISNLLLSPLVKYINSHPLNDSVEVEFFYTINIQCRRKEETAIRELLLENIHDAGIHLRKIASQKVPHSQSVEVYASLMAMGNQSEKIEQIVGKLSLNSSIKAASWSNKANLE
jgi:putative Mg2+ transporter-C (MgtC) family protein